MCGIAGYFGKQSIVPDRIAQTLEAMKNRGPDARAHVVIRDGGVAATLLHSRLSILDLDPRSNQPFVRGDCTVVFNGEIYNYLEIKKDLEARGVRFSTTSDTEVLLEAYRHYGAACVERFEGMWAFALNDSARHTLLLSRDRFGEKPLYLFPSGDGVFFGSEVKFLRALSGRTFPINRQHVLRYLINGYKALYKTQEMFFKGIREVPAATNVTIGSDGAITEQRYWTPSVAVQAMTFDEAVVGFRERFLDAVKIRLRSDVPLAFCLSGGVDSAAIASVAAKRFGARVHAFSIIDEDERYNEEENIRATVEDLSCASTLIRIPKENFFPRLRELIAYHDAPIATISYYVHAFLSEAIAGNGYRVALSGTGADELVTGYYDHFNLHLYEMRHHPSYPILLADWKKHLAPIVRNPILHDPEVYRKNVAMRDHIFLNNDVFAGYCRVSFAEPFTEERYCDALLRNRMLNELFHEVVPVILHEDDLNSMRYSIENRSPYLDSRLLAFASSIPNEHLIRDGYAKVVLREAMTGILNDRVRLDRHKKGFNASIHSLVDFSSASVRDELLDPRSLIFEIVDRKKIAPLLARKPLSNSFSKFLFNFINAKMFLELYG